MSKNKEQKIDEEIVSIDPLKEPIDKTGKKEDETISSSSVGTLKDEIEKRKKKAKIFLLINIGIFIFSILVLALFYYLISKPENNLVEQLTKAQETAALDEEKIDENKVQRKIDGVMVPEGEDNNFLIATMIDNHKDARPHAGISRAHLVFEAEVEGAATRIMAVFSSGQDIKEIGPVRSARPYFIDWARELSALYVHVGGSPDALVKIQQDKILDINEFYNGKYFWRGTDKSAPHNVYTSSENLDKYLSDKSADRNRIIPWNFKEDLPESDRATSSVIRIDYKIATDRVEWKYDRKSNYYQRYVAGEAYFDKSGESVHAKNVVVMEAVAQELDEKLRLDMDTIGSGKSMVCMDGKCQNGGWEKKHPADRTRFFKEDGVEIKFNAGMTWIQVVRPGVKYGDNN